MSLMNRIKAARDFAGLTQEELVNRLRNLPGVESFSQQALTKLETGKSKKSAYLTHIALACNINPYWLATGVGDMAGKNKTNWIGEDKAQYVVTKAKPNHDDKLAIKLQKIWVILSNEEKDSILSLANHFAKNKKSSE